MFVFLGIFSINIVVSGSLLVNSISHDDEGTTAVEAPKFVFKSVYGLC